MTDMDDRRELAAIARALRAHLEWLEAQGVEGLPLADPPPAPRAAPASATGEPRSAPAPRPPGFPATGEPRTAPAPRPPEPSAVGESAPASRPPDTSVLGERRSLEAIRAELGDCTRCKLHAGRKNIVFGVGNPDADLMFVGEGPGRDEDLQGEPFVGAAGQLLTKIIQAMGLRREEVYIANVVKCRPPQNRDPEAEEVAECSPFLFQQIASVRPKVIVALGRPACATLLGAPLSTSITRLRGRWLAYRGVIPMMPTFHPAYLLRNPAAKRDVWEDMKQVVAELERLTGQKLELATRRDGA